jgi:hypothetical protein
MHARIVICHLIALAIVSVALCTEGTTATSKGYETHLLLLLQRTASQY